jgi:tropomyosin
VKAGHYERKVQALEAARDQWETKYEEMSKKYSGLQQELQELEASMGNV